MPEPINISLPFTCSHAFIIGINEYQNGISKLKTAVKDAQDIEALLRDIHRYKVHTAYDASKKELEDFLSSMKQIVGKDDRVFFYFAGHGIALDSEENPEGFLVPADANTNEKESLISMNVLRTFLEELPCKHGLVVLDCCFAGAFKWSTSFRSLIFDLPETLYAERFLRFVEHPAWQVITSAAHDQKAIDLLSNHSIGMREKNGGETSDTFNSPFAGALKKAINLEGRADVVRGKRSDGVITATELYLYLRDMVENAADEQEMNQSPAIFTLSNHDTKGEYIFLHPNHRRNLPPAPDKNPYRGLNAYNFEEEDVQVFFGRDKAIREVQEKLAETTTLTISAPSGTGKSSAIKAGLFPRLKQQQKYKDFHILWPVEGMLDEWEKLYDLKLDKKQIVFIDQYEEIFGLFDKKDNSFQWESSGAENNEGQNAFERILIELFKRIEEYETGRKKSKLKIIFGLRSDFEWQLKASDLGKRFWDEKKLTKFLYRLPPMSNEELKEAMTKPAWRIAYEFESEILMDRILEEISYSPGALPLLSFTLSKLYEHRNEDSRLFTEEAYENELGGINGVLSKHADQVFDALESEEEKDFMRQLMLRMVRLNDGSYSRRRIYLELSSLVLKAKPLMELDYTTGAQDRIRKNVLEKLIEANLLRKDQDEMGEYIEPIHDSLINHWSRCLTWIQEMGRENLVLQRQLWEAVVEHHQWRPDFYSQPGDTAPLWDNSPKLQQVQLAITDPKDVWFCQKGWGEKSISSMAYLLWENEEKKVQLEDMRAYHWFFEEEESKKYYPEYADLSKIFHQIKAQMNNWLNEAELDFVKRSFEQQQSEIERLKKERDDAKATALAAKARQIYPSDNTIGINLAFAAHKFFPNEETVASMAHILSDTNRQYYHKLDEHTGRVNEVAFSPEGKTIISASRDFSLILWSVETQRMLRLFKGHTDEVLSVAFSPDGNKIASGGADQALILWDVTDGKEIKRFVGHTKNIESVAFSPDGKWIASSGRDSTLRLWSVDSEEEGILFGGPINAMSLAFSKDGSQIVTGGYIKRPLIWSVEWRKIEKELTGHTGLALAVGFSPDGKWIASGASDQTIRLWDSETGEEAKQMKGEIGGIRSLAFSKDSKYLVSGSTDQTVRLWSVESGKELKCFRGHKRYVSSVAFSPDGKYIVSGSFDHTIRLWPVHSPQRQVNINADPRRVHSLVFTSDGKKLLSGGNDGILKLWSIESGEEEKGLKGHTKGILSVALSPDEKWALSASQDKTLRLWSLDSGEEVRQFAGHTTCDFSPDGKIVAGVSSKDRTIRLWKIESGEETLRLSGHEDFIMTIKFSPDGKYLMSAAKDGILRVWDLDTGYDVFCLNDENYSSKAVAFSPDSKSFIGGGEDFTIRMWDIADGRVIKNFEGHTLGIRALAFSPDGSMIASGSEDHSLRLWSVQSETEIYKFDTHENDVLAVAFSSDGSQLASGSSDKSIQVRDILLKSWDLDIHKLDEAERKKYKVEVEY